MCLVGGRVFNFIYTGLLWMQTSQFSDWEDWVDGENWVNWADWLDWADWVYWADWVNRADFSMGQLGLVCSGEWHWKQSLWSEQ